MAAEGNNGTQAGQAFMKSELIDDVGTIFRRFTDGTILTRSTSSYCSYILYCSAPNWGGDIWER